MKKYEFNPFKIVEKFKKMRKELGFYKNYKSIIESLSTSGKILEAGFSIDEDYNLYLGVDLNPELLMYEETSQESVELRLVGEKMKRYNDFLSREGLLDSVKVEYERVKNDSFYGYIIQISFSFKEYSKSEYHYSIYYFSALSVLVLSIMWTLISLFF
jgi:hypothetical protein